MTADSSNGFVTRHRGVIALGAALTAIVLLVLVYRLTASKPEPTSAVGEPIPEGDVLKVGALPVT